MSDLTILIPAAGASSRMRGDDKLVRDIDGTPLLRRTAIMALATQHAVWITMRPHDAARQSVVQDLAVTTFFIPDAATGLSASLRGAAAVMRGTHLLILPADMPDLTTEDLRQMIGAAAQAPHAIVRATGADGTPGHPVVFPPDLLPDFAHLTGDEGARSLLQAHTSRIRYVTLPGQHALTDLDTPEAWTAWSQSANSTRPL